MPGVPRMTPRLIAGTIDLGRWQRLTAHLKINGQPLESVLLRLADERRNPPPPAPENAP
jgi:hypothetical protein